VSYFRDGDHGDYFIVPIQLRADVRADLRLPKDLTAAEARRVANVVQALAVIPAPGNKEDGKPISSAELIARTEQFSGAIDDRGGGRGA